MQKKILHQCLRTAFANNDKHPDWEGYHHFSFVIQENKIIEYGSNMVGSPIIVLGYPSYGKTHAEFNTFNRAKGLMNRSRGFEMVNVRLTRTGRIGDSCPCKACRNFISKVGGYRFWFTNDKGNFVRMDC